MSEPLLDAAGRRRSPATLPDFQCRPCAAQQRDALSGRPPTIEEIVSEIDAYHERFGPDQPWGFFADPTGWKCSPRYCAHHAACPDGGGL